jgi:peptidyl-prolyl cis-trans isomerase SurA
VNTLRSLLLGVLPLFPCVGPVVAQEVTDVPRIRVDYIAAIVGDTPIPYSAVRQRLNTYQQQGNPVPSDPDSVRLLERDLLRGLIDQELLVQAAERDTMVQVTEEEVQAAVEEIVKEVRERYPSLADLQRDLSESGFEDLDAYRVWLGEQQRRDLLQNALLQQLQSKGEITPRYPTDAELLQAYEQRKASLPKRPATVSFRRISVAAQPDSSAIAAALMRADSVRKRILAGADFAEMAREYSDDPATKDAGGDVGWFRRGSGFAREFENAAFRLQPGFVSFPVYTQFGFHLIQVQRAEPASVQVRHILIAPTITEANIEAARVRADSIRQLLIAGASYDSLADLYHDPNEDRILNDIPRANLPPNYQQALAGAVEGSVVGPVVTEQGNNRTSFSVLRVVDVRPEGEVTFEDVKDQLRSQLAQQGGIERYLQTLRDATYIEIRL